jgi:YD repeat-containing protein
VISSDRRRGIAVIVLTALVAVPVTGLAQQPSIYYVYDALNRLVVVVDQDGNAATYTYDGVGNILRIDRFDASGLPGGVGISLFVPNAGKVGTSVEVFGKGLAPASTLAFNGTPATIVGATPNRLATTVPAGATSGPLSVTSELGAATSAAAFHVLGTLAVAPATAQVNVARPLQFQAIEDGTPTTNVRWSVNGIPGGDPASGIITTAGLYTAPGFVPARPTVTVAATHLDDVSNIASATVTILPPAMAFVEAPLVAVTLTTPRASNRSMTAAVSVAVADARLASAVATLTSLAVEPLVTAVAPPHGAPGTVASRLIVTGRGLAGTTALTFVRDNVIDDSVTAATLSVNPDGTEVTADVTIAPGAPSGARVVRVVTLAGTSTAAGTGGNVFTVP